MPATPTIPVEKWGKDHWSTFAYIEIRAVDHNGDLNREQMRCDPDLHPALAHRMEHSKKCPPTRLHGDVEIHDHDDWSCVDDMVAAGLLEALGSGLHPRFKLTAAGFLAAGSLRAHKANGGTFSEFTYTPEPYNVGTKVSRISITRGETNWDHGQKGEIIEMSATRVRIIWQRDDGRKPVRTWLARDAFGARWGLKP